MTITILSTLRPYCWCLPVVLLCAGWCEGQTTAVAEPASPTVVTEQLRADVRTALDKARNSANVLSQLKSFGQGSLSAYALIKAGLPPTTPAIQEHIREVQARIDGGQYTAGSEPVNHIYEATCEAMLLADVDPQGNKGRLEILRDYFVRKQLANGAWYYPAVPSTTAGDTSITQFAILGLWAVHRAQIDVPPETLSRAAEWLISTQRGDNGFAYHPFDNPGRPEDQVTSESMTAAGCGTLAIIRLMLFGEVESAKTPAVPVSRRRFGVLEQVPVAGEEDNPMPRGGGKITVSRRLLDQAISKSEKALGAKFRDGFRARFSFYFLYACERAGTLLGTDKFGDDRWYEAGVDYLLKQQQATGDWIGPQSPVSPAANTAFAMLFLSRATRTLVKPVPRERLVGGGLLVGGRGLPDELDRVDVRNGTVKERPKKGAVDELLGQLEQPQEISLPAVQQAIVESVSLDNPDELIGQLDRLRRLAAHPDAEVRQVALWALARSGEYRMAPVLIEGLSDPDPVVAWEASLGLCVLSRMPLGIVPANSKQPLPIAPPDVSDDNPESRAAYQRWHDQTKAAWDAWYLSVRPYDERDDRRQLPRK
jgi:hypothetical protein